LNVNNYS